MILSGIGIIGSKQAGGGGFDPDAQAYLDAVVSAGGTINSTIETETNTLFTGLKSNGFYSDLDILYLFLGGTSASTALNGIRTKSAFDITWNNVGDLGFSALGVTGGGSGYGNTNYNPRNEASPTDTSFGIYHTAGNFGANNGETYTWGAFDGTYVNNNRYNTGIIQFGILGYTTGSPFNKTLSGGSGNRGGSWIGTFDSTPTKTVYHNASDPGSADSTGGTPSGSAFLANQPYYLFTLNLNGSPYTGNFFNGSIRSFFIGKYFTQSEVETIDGLINTFNTALSRNTY
jgi:hypothetical protein